MIKKILIVISTASIMGYGQILKLSEESFEFGDISNIESVSREISFTNTGDKELVIDRVKASCGCTAGTLSKKNLQPGESGTINISFNPQGRSGLQRKSVRFFSNDTENSVKKLNFKANVVPIWGANPKIVEFITNESGDKFEKMEQTVTIENRADKALELDKIYCSNPNFIMGKKEPQSIAAGESMELTIKVKEDFIPLRYTYAYVFLSGKIGETKTSERIRIMAKKPEITQSTGIPSKK